MSRADANMGKPTNLERDRAVWRQCRTVDAPHDDAASFLDLAGYADDLLEVEERDRVAALLATDPEAAADVAAARQLAWRSGVTPPASEEMILKIITCTEPLIADAGAGHDRVLRLRPEPARPILHRFAEWGSLAAALAFASWLGFAMGSGASLSLAQPVATVQSGDTSFLPELLDPTTSFVRDLVGGHQT